MSGIMGMLLGAKTAIAAAVDEFFNRVTLLLPGDGTNGAQNNTFLDSSSNNFTITRNGNTTQGTFSPFSQTGWSNYFDGSSNLVAAANSAFSFASDFTIELWINPSSLTTDKSIFVMEVSAGSNTFFALNASTSSITVYLNSGSISFTATPASNIQLNTWSHIALVRSGSTVTVYVNGVAASGTGTSSATLGSSTTTFRIGGFVTTALNVCYISNFRVVNGRAVYTSAFTPPTAPVGATSGGQNPPTGTQTSLLTCQSNRFADNGGLATPNTMSVNGTPSVQAFSPFAPTAAYDAAVVGGSSYYDGTGDWLNCGSQTAYAFGTGTFTIEAWVYITSRAGESMIAATRASAGSTTGWSLGVGTSGGVNFYSNSFIINSAGSVPLNAWTHIALTREGTGAGQTKLYINGVSITTSTTAENYSNTGLGVGSVNDGSSSLFLGYMASFRMLKGTALTSFNLTAPLTNITNTSILLNFTNAGITDATAKNVLETVGNAQISTTQSKFGGSSMYFDGTGDQLVMPASENFEFGSGNFTVECWVYISGTSGSIINYSNGQTANSNFCWEIYQSSSTVIQATMIEGSTVYSASSSSFSLNAWNHVAAVRNGNTLTMYVNGTAGGTTANVTGVSISRRSGVTVKVSGYNNATGMITGYIDDLRITKGFARYTANFTAPTAAFALQ